MQNRTSAVIVFIVFAIAGGFAALTLISSFALAALADGYGRLTGGVYRLIERFSTYVLPVLLVFSGVPTAIQLWYGRPWQRATMAALSISWVTWLAIILIVFTG